MATFKSGQSVPYGMYFSVNPIDMTFVGSDDEELDGKTGDYRRIPTLLMLALAPAFGGIFVIAFPLLVFAAVASGLYKIATKQVAEVVEEHAYIAQSNFQPGYSYLTNQEGEKLDADNIDPELADLAAEVAEKRELERKTQN